MQLSPPAKRRATIAAAITAVVAVVLFVVYAVNLWQEGSRSAPLSADDRTGSGLEAGVFPKAGDPANPTSTDGSGSSATTKKGKVLPTGDPFANIGTGKLHTVRLEIVSDGAVSVGYRYRGGKGDGQQVVDRGLTLNRTVRGPLPVAQIGAQVLSNATYVTCTIYIDGVKVDSRTAKNPGYVSVCTS